MAVDYTDTKEELIIQTEKWLVKAREKRKKIEENDSSKPYLKNIDAYISDTVHFLEKEDYVRAFEAVVWAWSWMEILEQLGIIKSE